MDLLQLKYFQTVARHEHMTRAANELHIAQPSLSKVITRLENDLGVPLFDRTGRQIRLNQFGKVYLNRVERIFLELENGRRELSNMLGNENTKISLAMNNLFSLSKILEGFLKLHPNTSFCQTIGSTNKMQQQLLDGYVDICISSPPIEGDGIECIPLVTEEIFLIVPHGHKFANRNEINLIEAANEQFINFKEGFGIRDLTDKLCRQAGFTPNIVFESDIALNLLDLVNNNLGIALLPILQCRDWPEKIPVPLHIKDPICNRVIALSYVQGRYLPQVTKHFIDYIINNAKKFNINQEKPKMTSNK